MIVCEIKDTQVNPLEKTNKLLDKMNDCNQNDKAIVERSQTVLILPYSMHVRIIKTNKVI